MDTGLRMVTEELPHVQSAAMGLWVRAGSSHEKPENYGISHLIEHMLFKGTASRSAKEIAEAVDRIGGSINAFTGKEATCYYIKTLGSNLEKGCQVITDMFLNSVFDPQELEKEKNVIYEEIKMTEDTPEDDVHDILDELVFRGTELENCVIGTVESLAGITRQDILDYIEKEYCKERLLVSLAGNFDQERSREFFCENMKGLGQGTAPRVQRDAPYEAKYRVKVKDVEQSHICLGVQGLPLDHRLHYALALLSSIMGGSMSSRLFQSIREEKGLAYAVFSGTGFHVNRGIFSIYAGVSHKKVEETVDAIARELKLLAEKGVSREEFDMAREQMKSSFIFGQESVNSRMVYMGKNMLLLGRVRTPEEVLAKIDRVTMEDMAEAAGLISDIRQYCGALITNKDQDLKKYMLG